MEINEIYMRRALQLAALGEGFVSPNPMVGCVIVNREGEIIGEGWHRKFGGPHAEVNAISSVKDAGLLRDCTLYVTLEPCSHYGKTPPCADLLIRMGVPRVVIGCPDPFPEVSGRGIRKLREAGVEVATGCLEEDCKALNRRFITAHTLKRPFITLKWAQDLAGHMGSLSGRRIMFSDTLGSTEVHRLRATYDAIMIGSNTLMQDNPRLDVRLWYGRAPRPVTFSREGNLSPALNLASSDNLILLSPDEDLETNVRKLYTENGIISLLVEGGPTLLRSFIANGLWDEMRIETSGQLTEADIPAPRPEGVLVASRYLRDHLITQYRRE